MVSTVKSGGGPDGGRGDDTVSTAAAAKTASGRVPGLLRAGERLCARDAAARAGRAVGPLRDAGGAGRAR